MNYCKVCKVCRNATQQIPIQKVESYWIIENYCPNCDSSQYTYQPILSAE